MITETEWNRRKSNFKKNQQSNLVCSNTPFTNCVWSYQEMKVKATKTSQILVFGSMSLHVSASASLPSTLSFLQELVARLYPLQLEWTTGDSQCSIYQKGIVWQIPFLHWKPFHCSNFYAGYVLWTLDSLMNSGDVFEITLSAHKLNSVNSCGL
jgi:hypothetical protein